MMIELYFIYNGHRRIFLASFSHVHAAIEELKRHQTSYSAISQPRFRKSMSGETIRIDYGASDCYYLLTKGGNIDDRKEISVVHGDGLQSD